MRAYRVRDLDGRTPPPNATYVGAGRTDDRGVYRIYGLQPGAYVVVAGGQSSPSFGVVSPYDADAPTFYPSSTRDTAAEVTVRAGAEAAGVDIRYREEQGHRVTGKVEPSAVTAEPNYSIVLGLSYASSSIQAGMYYVNPSTSNLSFSFEGVADGDYDLNATLAGRDGLVGTAAPQRVTVRGTDVTGLRVALAPLASVSGMLVVERPRLGAQHEPRTIGVEHRDLAVLGAQDGRTEPDDERQAERAGHDRRVRGRRALRQRDPADRAAGELELGDLGRAEVTGKEDRRPVRRGQRRLEQFRQRKREHTAVPAAQLRVLS